MKLIKGEKMNKLVADEGKHIRDINDVYSPAGVDEQGNPTEEHFPFYSETVYLPIFIDEEKAMELYVEEPISKEVQGDTV